MSPIDSPSAPKGAAGKHLSHVRHSPYTLQRSASVDLCSDTLKPRTSKQSFICPSDISSLSESSSLSFLSDVDADNLSPTRSAMSEIEVDEAIGAALPEEDEMENPHPLAGTSQEDIPPPIVNIDHLRGFRRPVKGRKRSDSAATTIPERPWTPSWRDPSNKSMKVIVEHGSEPVTKSEKDEEEGDQMSWTKATPRSHRTMDISFTSATSSVKSDITMRTLTPSKRRNSPMACALVGVVSHTQSLRLETMEDAGIPADSRVKVHRLHSTHSDTSSCIMLDGETTPMPSPTSRQRRFDVYRSQSVISETETCSSSDPERSSTPTPKDRFIDSSSQYSLMSISEEGFSDVDTHMPSRLSRQSSMSSVRSTHDASILESSLTSVKTPTSSVPLQSSSQSRTESNGELIIAKESPMLKWLQSLHSVQQGRRVPKPLARSFSVIDFGMRR